MSHISERGLWQIFMREIRINLRVRGKIVIFLKQQTIIKHKLAIN